VGWIQYLKPDQCADLGHDDAIDLGEQITEIIA
jgi:hypothetical protein